MFAAVEEITIETMREDGSLRPAVPIWVVVTGEPSSAIGRSKKHWKYERSFLPALLAGPPRGAAFRLRPVSDGAQEPTSAKHG